MQVEFMYNSQGKTFQEIIEMIFIQRIKTDISLNGGETEINERPREV